MADKAGNVLRSLVGVEGDAVWSPDGESIAYSKTPGTVAIHTLTTGDERIYGPNVDRPLAWVLSGEALIAAAGYRVTSTGADAAYQAVLLQVADGKLTHVSELDNSWTTFWPSPDRSKAIFTTVGTRADLRLIDFSSLAVSPVPNAPMTGTEHRVPNQYLAFSPDGHEIAWLNVGDGIYKARLDGTSGRRVLGLSTGRVSFSPDLDWVAYTKSGRPLTWWIVKLDGTGEQEVGPIKAFAWRPSG